MEEVVKSFQSNFQYSETNFEHNMSFTKPKNKRIKIIKLKNYATLDFIDKLQYKCKR